jgi:DNA-directed RNA polymerase sigma subunit (sigma70/sigma32)
MDYVSQLYLSKAINSLREEHKGERMVTVLRMRFWENATLKDVADSMGVQIERARQVEAKALRLLRRKLSRTELADYLA